MPERARYLLIGGGLAAASAARAIRQSDPEGRIVLVTAEAELPYHRPPLSKEYLKGRTERAQIVVQPASWYEKRKIELWTGYPVTGLDPTKRLATVAGRDVIEYERCLLATGGRARRLGLPGSQLEGVYTLRDLTDSERIRNQLERVDSAVVIGASFIGMEAASAFAEAGLKTTVIELAPRVWPRLLDETLSAIFQRYFEDRGVQFVLSDQPVAFEGSGRLEAVRTRGEHRVPCGLAVVGVGIELNLEFLDGAGITVEDGVVVDEQLRTSVEGVYAAGDIALYPDVVFGKPMRIEHWDNAKAQGAHAGRNMVGATASYDHISYYFSDVFDLSLHVVGELDYDRVLVRGSTDDASFVGFYIRDDVLNAALTVNRDWPELEAAKALVRKRAVLDDLNRWADASTPLEELG